MFDLDNIISWIIGFLMGGFVIFFNEGIKIFANNLFSGNLRKAKEDKAFTILAQDIIKHVTDAKELVTTTMIKDRFFPKKSLYEVQKILDNISYESGGRFCSRDASTFGNTMEYWVYTGE